MSNIEPIRAAVVVDGIVVNVEMIELGFEREGVTYVPSDTAGIGDRYEGGEFVPQPPHDPATHRAVWRDGAWVIEPRDDIPPPPPIEISADVLFFDRMTDEEYDDLDASIRAGETARVYRGWAAATSFTEGTAMWTLLDKHLSLVVTADRKGELLARPVQSAAAAPMDDEAIAA